MRGRVQLRCKCIEHNRLHDCSFGPITGDYCTSRAGYIHLDPLPVAKTSPIGKEQAMKKLMIAAIIAAVSMFAVGTVDAGCGKKVATVGKLTSYDKAAKKITIEVTLTNDKKAKKTVVISVTPTTKTMGGKTLDKLVGATLSVVSEHSKADFIIPVSAKS